MKAILLALLLGGAYLSAQAADVVEETKELFGPIRSNSPFDGIPDRAKFSIAAFTLYIDIRWWFDELAEASAKEPDAETQKKIWERFVWLTGFNDKACAVIRKLAQTEPLCPEGKEEVVALQTFQSLAAQVLTKDKSAGIPADVVQRIEKVRQGCLEKIPAFVMTLPKWQKRDVIGLTIALDDPVQEEMYRFGKSGFVAVTAGKKGKELTCPVYKWRIQNGKLELRDEDDGLVQSWRFLKRDGNILYVEEAIGRTRRFTVL